MKNIVYLLGEPVEKKNAHSFLTSKGYKTMRVDVNAFIWAIDPRWQSRTCIVPENKKGNLKEFAGKKVDIITTTIARNVGARINFYIKTI